MSCDKWISRSCHQAALQFAARHPCPQREEIGRAILTSPFSPSSPARHDLAHSFAPRDPHPGRARREAAHRARQLPAEPQCAHAGLQPEDGARPGDQRERGRRAGRARHAEVAAPGLRGLGQPRAALRAQRRARAGRAGPERRAAGDADAARAADGRGAAPEHRAAAPLRGHLVRRRLPRRTLHARAALRRQALARARGARVALGALVVGAGGRRGAGIRIRRSGHAAGRCRARACPRWRRCGPSSCG